MSVPAPRSPRLGPLYETVRYEEGRWPLWRWDRNLRYIAKSLVHRRTPWTDEDRDWHARARDYLERGSWMRATSRTTRWVAGGDLMWIRSGFADALSPLLRARIEAADLALVNLETPIVPERPVPRLVYETLHYNCPRSYLDAFRSDRPRVVSLTNNHALDQGLSGLSRTHEVVQAAGCTPIGGPNEGDDVRRVIVGDLTIGVLGMTYDINHLVGPPPRGIAVERFGDPHHEPDWRTLERRIARAREGADLVVLMAHWGFEYEYWPAVLQRAHARRLIELGVDVVIGSSPHVLQPVELVSIDGADDACPFQARRGGQARFGLVAWSLGNLCTIMPTLACQVGALLMLEVGRDAAGMPAFSGLSAVATYSARGMGKSWIDGGTRSLDELRGDGRAARAHARAMLGPLVLSSEHGGLACASCVVRRAPVCHGRWRFSPASRRVAMARNLLWTVHHDPRTDRPSPRRTLLRRVAGGLRHRFAQRHRHRDSGRRRRLGGNGGRWQRGSVGRRRHVGRRW